MKSIFSARFFSKAFLKSLFYNRWVQLAGGLISVGFCLVTILANFQKLWETLQTTPMRIGWVLCAWLVTFLTVLLGALTWWATLRGLGIQIPFRPAANIHLQSAISKYIPGYAWQFLSKGVLTVQQGVEPYTAGVAMTWELVQILWTGVCVSLLTFPQFLLDSIQLSRELEGVIRIGGLVLLPLPILLAAARPRWFLRKSFDLQRLSLKWLTVSSAAVCLGWFVLGGSLQLFLEALGSAGGGDMVYFTFAFTTSLITGILVIPVPNGLGIREGILVFLLSKIIPNPVAILAAIFSRLAITVSEVMWVLIIVILRTNPRE